MLAFLLALTAQAPLEEIPATRLIYLPGRFAHQCPGEVEVQEGVTRRLGRTPFAEPPARLLVLALEGDGEAPSVARAELFDAEMTSLGARVLESTEGCSELVEAAELAISIALAPSLALGVPPPEPEPIEPRPVAEPLEAADVEAAPVEVEQRVDERPPYMSWMPAGSYLRFGGGTHGVIGFGPQAAPGLQFTVAFKNGPFELSYEQKTGLPRIDDALGILHGGGGNTLMVCGDWTWWAHDDGGFGVLGCGTGSTGSVWALGDVIGIVPYLGTGGRVMASFNEWDRDVLRVWLQVEWSVVRPSFQQFTTEPGQWEQDSPVTVMAGLTYEIAWP